MSNSYFMNLLASAVAGVLTDPRAYLDAPLMQPSAAREAVGEKHHV